MGAINFSGGSWVGGGYGKLFEREFFETDGSCCICGEEESDCECGQFDTFDLDYCRDLYKKYENNLSEIEDRVVKWLEKNKRKIIVGKRSRLVSSLLKGIKENEGGFLKIEAGYYAGFQIYADNNRLGGDYGDDRYLDDKDVKCLFETVNDTLNKIKWDYWLE
jgi:hypothetical protein